MFGKIRFQHSHPLTQIDIILYEKPAIFIICIEAMAHLLTVHASVPRINCQLQTENMCLEKFAEKIRYTDKL